VPPGRTVAAELVFRACLPNDENKLGLARGEQTHTQTHTHTHTHPSASRVTTIHSKRRHGLACSLPNQPTNERTRLLLVACGCLCSVLGHRNETKRQKIRLCLSPPSPHGCCFGCCSFVSLRVLHAVVEIRAMQEGKSVCSWSPLFRRCYYSSFLYSREREREREL